MSDRSCGLTSSQYQELIKLISSLSEIETATVFGSRAKGTYKTGSDVDLAISGDNVSYTTISKLSYLLNEESVLPYYFDVINIGTVTSEALLVHIREFGVKIFSIKPKLGSE